MKKGRSEATSFISSRLPMEYFELLSSYGKKRGATINDLILTAYYRAMFKNYHAPYGIPMDIASDYRFETLST